LRSKELTPRPEWAFKVGRRKRIADLAIVDSMGDCHALLEIKVEDGDLPGQLDDYLEFAQSHSRHSRQPIPFTLLCKYLKPAFAGGDGRQTLSLSSFCRALAVGKSSGDPAVAMFVDYVKDMGIMFTDVAESDLRMLLRRFFHDKGSGRIAAKGNIGTKIPGAFTAVINNQFAVSELLRESLGKYRATVDFRIEFEAKEGEEDGYANKDGGFISTFTAIPLVTTSSGSKDWLYLQYGLYYGLAKDRPVISAYASLTGNRSSDTPKKGKLELYVESTERSFARNYSPDKLSLLLKSCASEVLRKSIASKGLPSVYVASVRGLAKAMK
jgi:hypothetical protein